MTTAIVRLRTMMITTRIASAIIAMIVATLMTAIATIVFYAYAVMIDL